MSASSQRVLLVEDDNASQKFECAVLARLGLESRWGSGYLCHAGKFRGQLRLFERLGEEVVHACGEASFAVAGHHVCSERDDRNVKFGRSFDLPDFSRGNNPVHDRHRDIHENREMFSRHEFLDRLGPTGHKIQPGGSTGGECSIRRFFIDRRNDKSGLKNQGTKRQCR